jgi:hypothetical protein
VKRKKVRELRLTTFSRHSAVTMARFYRDTLGCPLLQEPTSVGDGSDRWFVVVDATTISVS